MDEEIVNVNPYKGTRRNSVIRTLKEDTAMSKRTLMVTCTELFPPGVAHWLPLEVLAPLSQSAEK
jgi:hypothetical protein